MTHPFSRNTSTLILMLSALSLTAFAETAWVDLGGRRPGQPALVTATHRPAGLSLNLDIYGFHLTQIDGEAGPFQQLTIPDCGLKGLPGDPELPFRTILVEVPNGVQVDYQVNVSDPVTLAQAVPVYPRQFPEPETRRTGPAVFAQNPDAYEADISFPAQFASLALDARLRGHRLLAFEVSPIQYNPVQQTLTAYRRTTIDLTYTGNVDTAAEDWKQARSTPFFDRLLESFAACPDVYPAESAPPRTSGDEYLVIAPDTLHAALAPLLEWKRLKGYTVRLVSTGSTGSTAEEIKTYLQTEYNANPSLLYVLLVGDQPQIPGYPVSPDAYGGSFVSDLPYSLLDGPDYFADVILGRLPVRTASECAVVVQKILAYDRTPDPGDWYSSFLMAAYLQDYDDNNCRADRWFYETGITVMHYLRDSVGLNPYYAATTDHLGCNPYRYRLDSYPHRPSHPDIIPPEDSALLTTEAISTAAVSAAINAGVGLVQHRDHGAESGWGDPPYTSANILADLHNGIKTPVVYSINCLTGAFDWGADDCFAETFLKKPDGGAVGLIAATEVSYSGFNDLLTHGLYDSIWDVYDPSDGGNPNVHSWRPAEGLVYGKYYMYLWEGDNSDTLYSCRLFHWFGDPEMMLRLGPQSTPAVTIPEAIPVGLGVLSVLCTAEGALVAVTDNGSLLGREIVTGGMADVSLTPVPTAPRSLSVAVTGANLFPAEGSCQVIPATGPFLTHTGHELTVDGTTPTTANPGRAIVMPVTLKNIGVALAEAITATLSTDSSYVSITSADAVFAAIAAGDTGRSSSHYAYVIHPETPDQTAVRFTITWSTAGRATGSTSFLTRVQAPILTADFVVDDTAAGCDQDGIADFDETAVYHLTLANGGSCPATSVTVSLGAPGCTISGPVTLASVPAHGLATADFTVIRNTGSPCPATDVAFSTTVTASELVSAAHLDFTDIMNADFQSFQFADGMEAGINGWTHASAPGMPEPDDWQQATSSYHSSSHSWWASDANHKKDAWLVTPELTLGDRTTLTFWHRFNLEYGRDGAVLEISTDGGSTWHDLGGAITLNGYSVTIGMDYYSPIRGRAAWSGEGSWQQVAADLGTYSPGPARLRFRIACDTSYPAGGGWWIDDVTLTSQSAICQVQVCEQVCRHGDLDQSNVVDSADSDWLAAYLDGSRNSFTCPAGYADLNGNAAVDAADLAILLNHLAGHIPVVPVP